MQIGCKKFLFQNMKKYYSSLNKNVFDFLPFTFHINPLDCEETLKNFKEILLEKA